MQFIIRHWRGIIGFACIWIAIPVVGEFAIEIARDFGFYKHPTERMGKAMGILLAIADYPGFKLVVIAAVGLFAGIWLDALMKGRKRMDAGSILILIALFIGVAGLIMREVRASNEPSPSATISPATANHSGKPADAKEGQKVTARLRVRYAPNSPTPEIIQSDNVLKPSSMQFAEDGTESTDPVRIKWTMVMLTFDRTLTVPNIRILFEGGVLAYEVRTFTPRNAVILFRGSIGDKIVDIEAYG